MAQFAPKLQDNCKASLGAWNTQYEACIGREIN